MVHKNPRYRKACSVKTEIASCDEVTKKRAILQKVTDPSGDINYLNLPGRVDLGTQGKTYYHYDATGNKLAKYIENNKSSENTTIGLPF